MPDSQPTPQAGTDERLHVLIAGSGVAGLEAAFALHELAGDRVTVTLLSPADEFVYRPMAIGEPFASSIAHRYSLARLASAAHADLVRDALTEVDPAERMALTTSGQRLSYDALLVCPGVKMEPAYEHGTTIDDARMDELLHGLVQDVEGGYIRRLAIVVPAPAPWPLPAYELALMSSERAWSMEIEMSITVLTPEQAPLVVFGQAASQAVSRLLAERHIEVVTSAYCEVPSEKEIRIYPGGRMLEVDRIVALPALKGPAFPGLPQDGGGFIPVDQYGQVRGVERVWAAGDATAFPVKHGGIAAQLAATAAQSIAALAGACPEPEPFDPVVEGVLLTGGSPRHVQGQVTGGHGDSSELTRIALREAPPKIAAPYLTPHLTSQPSGGVPASA